MVSPIVEGFSLSHAQVLDGTQSFLQALASAVAEKDDIYGVSDASLEPDTGDWDNEGDDAILSTWSWFNFADISVEAGYMSFPLIANLTGQTVSSSGTGNSQVFGVDLWGEDSMNTPPRPMIVRMPSKDKDGVVRSLAIGLYRVQFKPITFSGPTYKDGLKINYNGRALTSAVDEKGVPFPDGKKRPGRLLSFL